LLNGQKDTTDIGKQMQTKAVRIYGKKDLRLESFELPEMQEDEIIAKVVSDSICMSTYKAAQLGANHKRVPDDVSKNPTIIGHEFSGEIIQVGKRWKSRFHPGEKFSIQPALNYKGSLNAPGYSFPYIGGNAAYVLIPKEVMEMECLLPYSGAGFFPASLAEPMSCVIGAFHASYHTRKGTYEPQMGIVEGGKLILMAAAGPMGLAAINYAIYSERKPALLVVTDIDQTKLDRATKLYSPGFAASHHIQLHYVNTALLENPDVYLRSLSGGTGYDDAFVFAPVSSVIELADRMLKQDGCLNFFSGPTDPNFKAQVNFYKVHYGSTHFVGTTGGTNHDMTEALEFFSRGLDPSGLVSHIGGLNAVIDTTLHLPEIPGGKKLIYTHLNLPLTAITDFEDKGKKDPLYARLAEITRENNGLWSIEAESFLLSNGTSV